MYILAMMRESLVAEISLEGWKLFTPRQWAAFQDEVQRVFETQGEVSLLYVDHHNFDYDSYDAYMETIETEEISDDAAQVLITLFGEIYGFFLDATLSDTAQQHPDTVRFW